MKQKSDKNKFFVIPLLFFLVLMIASCIPNQEEFPSDIPENYTDNYDGNQDDITDKPVAEANYEKSDKLTEIIFSRDIVLSDRTEKATFKITGYLEEINPGSDDLTMYYDKAYNFYDGKIEWTISSRSQESEMGGQCVYTYTITSNGNDAITNLNIPYEQNNGKDESGNLIHLKPWGDLKLGYKTQGISGKSELQLLGSVLIPYDYETDVDVTDPSANIHATCSGVSEDTTVTKKITSNSAFPLILYGASATSQSGQASLIEMSYENSGNAQLRTFPILNTNIVFIPTDGPWKVSWKLEMP